MLAVLPRCLAVFLTKMFDESTGVVKSAVVGDLSNGMIRAAQLLFGVFQTQPHDILGVGHIQILLEESGQIDLRTETRVQQARAGKYPHSSRNEYDP